jgi:hypothetical protein
MIIERKWEAREKSRLERNFKDKYSVNFSLEQAL